MCMTDKAVERGQVSKNIAQRWAHIVTSARNSKPKRHDLIDERCTMLRYRLRRRNSEIIIITIPSTPQYHRRGLRGGVDAGGKTEMGRKRVFPAVEHRYFYQSCVINQSRTRYKVYVCHCPRNLIERREGVHVHNVPHGALAARSIQSMPVRASATDRPPFRSVTGLSRIASGRSLDGRRDSA